MALKPTIYKFRISLSDLNRDYYDTLNLTIAQHPSENAERMMARVLAYCINAQADLVFTKGLSTVEEPDIWVRTLEDRIALWIDVGEPAVERIKKACRQSDEVRVYSFNSRAKADVWWEKNQSKFRLLDASLFQFDWEEIQALAEALQRGMDFSVTITGESAFIATENGEHEIHWWSLK